MESKLKGSTLKQTAQFSPAHAYVYSMMSALSKHLKSTYGEVKNDEIKLK